MRISSRIDTDQRYCGLVHAGRGEAQRTHYRNAIHGAQLASRYASQKVFQFVWGIPGREIAAWERLAPKLAVPACEFAILAGSENGARIKNPLVTGDDDLVLSVGETKLAGARDFAVLPLSHWAMRNDPRVLEYTRRFLAEGCFIAPDRRCPLPAPPEPPDGV